MLSRQTNRDIKECFFAPVGWFGLLTVHILSYIKSLTPMAFGTHPLTVSWKQHEPLCVCVCVCGPAFSSASRSPWKPTKMSICYFISFVFGPDWIRAKPIGFLNWGHAEKRRIGSINWLCSGSVKPCRSSWFSDQREARESFFSSCC